MSALSRLVGRQLSSKLMKFNRNSLLLVRAVTIKPEPYKKPDTSNFQAFNEKMKRPLSPHLTIYAPELTSMLSISHRISGAAMLAAVLFFGISTLFIQDFTKFIDNLNVSQFVIVFMKFAVSFPFNYHVIAGIRHLLFDMGLFLSMKEVFITGYIMMATVIAATTFLCLLPVDN